METTDTVPQNPRALAAMSPALDHSIGIVVCIPCFRRPQHLRRTLESLVQQRTGRRFAVVMVENDASRSESVPVASEFLAAGNFPGVCVVEPRQGNCHAINAAFETALATFPDATCFLMIDDDEIASEDWLERMVSAAETMVPISSAGRCCRNSTTSESAACAAIRRSRLPTTSRVRCR